MGWLRMAFTETTKKQEFENKFLLTKGYSGQIFATIEGIDDFLKKEYPELKFFDYRIEPQLNDESNIVSTPFNYIIAQQGSKRISNPEFLGFKLDSEDIFRVGPPHLEETEETVCFGKEKGYRLYSNPDKKLELLIHTQ